MKSYPTKVKVLDEGGKLASKTTRGVDHALLKCSFLALTRDTLYSFELLIRGVDLWIHYASTSTMNESKGVNKLKGQ